MLAMILAMFVAIAAVKLQPDGPLGSLLQNPVNFAIGIAVLLLATGLFGLLFMASGSSIVRRLKD